MRRRRRAVWLHLISAVVVGAATSVLTAVPSIANPVLVVTSTLLLLPRAAIAVLLANRHARTTGTR